MPASAFNALKRIAQSIHGCVLGQWEGVERIGIPTRRRVPQQEYGFMKTTPIFLDGRMVKAKAALIDSLAPGIVDGEGVFETMRVYDGKIFALEDHLDRLFRGLKALKIRFRYSKKQCARHLYRTIQINRQAQARIRLAVWREERRLRIAIVCQNFREHSDSKYKGGFKAVISDVRRKKTRFSHIKSMDYACFLGAFKDAEKKGYDEAILLNSRREVVEGSRTNIFLVKRGVLYTPAAQCGCLNGITRQMIIKHARQMKIPFKAVVADIQKLLKADEAFVTNSLMGVMPLTAIGKHSIGQGKPGPLTGRLLRAYRRNVHSSCPVNPESV